MRERERTRRQGSFPDTFLVQRGGRVSRERKAGGNQDQRERERERASE